MGLKHYHGVGVAEDKREAMKWFKEKVIAGQRRRLIDFASVD